MTIFRGGQRMTSDRSPEYAYRVPGSRAWRLSWLPGHEVSEARALAGMELDELISDPGGVDEPAVLAMIHERAAVLGVEYADVVLLLVARLARRGPEPSAPPRSEDDAWMPVSAAGIRQG
ncbi:hypothetical protein ACWDSJ_03145 [Nocardia sp. NPDC003482]